MTLWLKSIGQSSSWSGSVFVDSIIWSALATVLAGMSAFKWWFRDSSRRIRNLKNKHVVITGGSSGIGLHTAMEALVQGAFVTLISRTSANLYSAIQRLLKDVPCDPARMFSKVADVGNYEAIRAAIQEAYEWKPIDVLICNAGLTRGGQIDNQSVEDVDLIIRTNLTGTIYSVHAALPLMKKHSKENPTSIVLIGSLASKYMFYGHSVYTATKHAVRGLAESLRLELLPYNIYISLVCPGFVDTPLLEEAEKDEDNFEILKALNMYDRKTAESPRELAKTVLESAKEGRYVVTKNNSAGLVLSTLTRGFIPPESVGRCLVELILYFPFRVLSVLTEADVRKTILKHYHNHK